MPTTASSGRDGSKAWAIRCGAWTKPLEASPQAPQVRLRQALDAACASSLRRSPTRAGRSTGSQVDVTEVALPWPDCRTRTFPASRQADSHASFWADALVRQCRAPGREIDLVTAWIAAPEAPDGPGDPGAGHRIPTLRGSRRSKAAGAPRNGWR
ncbi:MAG: hypothetical protein IPI87_10840 [Betaproteobacteria bacterium]|nr:hypothetical protein [Betaproteobacteria bacterium]